MDTNNRIKAKPVGRFRSTFESTVAKDLDKAKVAYQYEGRILPYLVPEIPKKYIVDFELPNGILIECKGYFTLADRKKMLWVIASNPDKDIRMLFQNAKVRISKGSKITYAKWCERNGIQWAEGTVPKSWLKERK